MLLSAEDTQLVKNVKISELFSEIPDFLQDFFGSCEYPWELLPKIKEKIREIAERANFTEISDGIWVGENVKISESATLIPPLIIGSKTEIRPSAYLRGNVIIGCGCVIGNSSEVKNSIILSHVQIPHYNYVGDSILGAHSHMGAGSVCSNLKSDDSAVIIRGAENYETGLRKVGAFLADGADIGCGCVLNPGTVVGADTSVYPLTALRGVYPAGCIVKSTNEVVKRI